MPRYEYEASLSEQDSDLVVMASALAVNRGRRVSVSSRVQMASPTGFCAKCAEMLVALPSSRQTSRTFRCVMF